jgi:hypothetical protein
LAGASIRGVKIDLAFFEEFYNFSANVNGFLDMGAIEDAFILAFIKYFPGIKRKQVAEILNIDILDIKVELYYSMLASFIPRIREGGLEFLELL